MSLKDYLRDTLQLDRDDLFKVDVKDGFSFFNTEAVHSERVMEMLNGVDYNGRRVNVEVSSNEGGGRSNRRDHNNRGGGRDRGRSDRPRFDRGDRGGSRSSGGGRGFSERSGDRNSSSSRGFSDRSKGDQIRQPKNERTSSRRTRRD